ncbi:MAG: hypothetical protein ABIQ58_06310, partial [Candidatus Limnocylindrales bacterium]
MTRFLATPARRRSHARRTVAMVALVLTSTGLLTTSATPVRAATYTVSVVADSGAGSLRDAITASNASATADTIDFAIPGAAPHVIQPLSALPAITDGVVIDGTSALLVDGSPGIVIDGSSAGATSGLTLIGTGGNTEIRALRVIDFASSGIYVDVSGVLIEGNFIGTDGTADQGNRQAGITVLGSGNQIRGNLISGNGLAPELEPCCGAGFGIWLAGAGASGTTIVGNRIGTNASGTAAIGNGNYAIVVSSPSNQIGGTAAADRNVISGNGRGIQYAGSTTQGNTLQGNYIGTNAAGTAAIPNGVHGVLLNLTGDPITIGGTAAGAGNVIAASDTGILLANASNAVIQGNLIGVGANGVTALGNAAVGVQVTGAIGFPANANAIGGTVAAARNVIANNGIGVLLGGADVAGNRVIGNEIRDNTGLGIDLGAFGITANDGGDGDSGPNGLQNFPLITGTGPSAILGTLDSASGTYRIEIFQNASCDGSGNGEGSTLLKVLTGVAPGSFAADAFPINGTLLTATATNEATGNTSEFGPCHTVTDGVPPAGTWQGSKSVTTAGTFVASGTGAAGPAQFTYSVPDANPEVGDGESGEWNFYTTAATAGTINIPWRYTGFHAFFQVRVSLRAFVIGVDTPDTETLLIDAGPANCCATPSAGFDHEGTASFTVQPGDVYGFTLSGSNGDTNETLTGDLTLGGGSAVSLATPILFASVATPSNTAHLYGIVDGAAMGDVLALEVIRGTSCSNGLLSEPTVLGPITVTTDGAGYFQKSAVAGIASGQFVAVRVTSPSLTATSPCVRTTADNDYWPKALTLPGASVATQDVVEIQGKARWYRFPIVPDQRITVTLSGLPADYDLAVFKDIAREFESQLVPADAADLTKLTAEFAPSVFSPSVFSPSVFSPSVFSPDAYAPSVFSPSVFSPSVFSPSVFSPSVFSPDAIAKAFSSAQTRSIIGVSATAGTGNETVVVNTWNNTGYFYVRVSGRGGAFDPNGLFTVDVQKSTSSCSGVTDTTLLSRGDVAGTDVIDTIVLTDSTRLALGDSSAGTLRSKLNALIGRADVKGVLVDVGLDTRVNQLKVQAAANAACPFATNLVAEEIKAIVDSYRAANPGLRYVVIVGGDNVIPFFRYPDQSLLGQESGYVPPVRSDSASEASLRRDFVLSQDAYGSGTEISLRTSEFPVPGLAVGRLIETPTEISGLIDAFVATSGVVAPTSSLVTGYDFLEDAANAVATELGAGTGTTPDKLITANGKSPQDPASWTADQLRTKLLGSRHDISFLAGHFSANSALAADFATSVLTTELAASSVNLQNAIVFSAGCHSGYNIVDGEAVTGVTLQLDWAQAFAQKRATLIAGTGYQYGDTDFLEYSERLYRDFARELRAGTGSIAIGEALVKAKLSYLSTTTDVRGIHEKALLEATLFGFPMLGVNMPSGRGGSSAVGGAITPTPVVAGPAGLDLASAPLHVSPALTPRTLSLKNPPYDATATSTVARWLDGRDGVVTNPAEPALPLQVENVTSTNGTQVLRGVGFRGGSYTDTSPIVPLSGAPTTELRGVHAPFVSPVFYPMKLWSPNYYGALGGTGGTNLLITPAQHKSFDPVAGTSIQRKYTGLDLQLFYSGDRSAASLSDAPSIVGVEAVTEGDGVSFRAQVVGDPAAAIYSVWVTSTTGAGTWASLDLTQCIT